MARSIYHQYRRQPKTLDGFLSRLRKFAEQDPDVFFWDKECPKLLELIEAESRQNPSHVAEILFAEIMTTLTYLTMRENCHLLHVTQQQDASNHWGFGALPKATRDMLPHFMELCRHVAEIAQLHAATARQWALTRAKEAETERQRSGAKCELPDDPAHHAGHPDGPAHVSNDSLVEYTRSRKVPA